MTEEQQQSTDIPTGRGRLRAFVGRHKGAVGAGLTGLAALAGIVAVLVPTPLFGADETSTPQRVTVVETPATPELSVAAFDLDAVTQSRAYDASGSRYTEDGPVARVQIAFRNAGDAPAFLTRAIFTVRAHEVLDTCLEWGDAVVITDSVDVSIPYELDDLPWTHEQSISFRVAPNEVDRMEFTFSVPELPPFVQPVVLSVDIAVQEDLGPATPVGTARLVVPAASARTALAGMVEDPIVPIVPGCNERNLEIMQDVLATPALERNGSSPEFVELMAALEAFDRGEFYVFPESASAAEVIEDADLDTLVPDGQAGVGELDEHGSMWETGESLPETFVGRWCGDAGLGEVRYTFSANGYFRIATPEIELEGVASMNQAGDLMLQWFSAAEVFREVAVSAEGGEGSATVLVIDGTPYTPC